MGALDCVKPGLRAESTIKLSSNSTLNDSGRDLESQKLKTDEAKKHSVWWTIGIDAPLVIIMLLTVILLEFHIIPNFRGGFFCRDRALNHAYTGDTISMFTLMSAIGAIPFNVIFPTEFILSKERTILTRLKQAFSQANSLMKVYVFGLLFNLMLVEIIKVILGSPRPDFNAICRPDVWDTCRDSEYVTSFRCTSTEYSAWLQRDASHSFPSGHTSLSVYCVCFGAWYLQKRAFSWKSRTVVLVPFIQLCLLTFAALASLSRITDHRHHWWDVLFGVGVGFATVYYAVVVLLDNFSQFSAKDSSVLVTEDSQPTTVLDGRRGDATP